ncbi:MAG: FtsX-like permease family protein [Bryobacteraceae bacterium]
MRLFAGGAHGDLPGILIGVAPIHLGAAGALQRTGAGSCRGGNLRSGFLRGHVTHAGDGHPHEALGAERRDVLAMVLRQAALLAAAGLAAGLAASLALTRFLSSLLFEVRTTDLATLAAIAALLIAVALGASYLPARRAASVDPTVALRYE